MEGLDLRSLRDRIASATSLPELRRGLEALGLRSEEAQMSTDMGYARIVFQPPVEARALCESMGWQRPYAVSGDVHQSAWRIWLWESDLWDPYGARIHTVLPRLGAWAVSPQLVGRPRGKLPGVSSGASPAYDLMVYGAKVAVLEIRGWEDMGTS